MKRVIAVFLAGSLLAACASVDHNTVFDGAKGNAFVITVSREQRTPFFTRSSFGYQKVDLPTSTFIPGRFQLGKEKLTPRQSSDQHSAQKARENSEFPTVIAAAGDYAYVYEQQESILEGRATSTVISCNSRGAMIIRLKPGYVNIVSSFYAHPDAKAARAGVESQIKEVLKSYPNITAPIAFAEPLGVVTFPDSPVHGNTKTCGYSGHFDFQH